VLILNGGRTLLTSRQAVRIGAALAIAVITFTAARADDTLIVGGCTGTRGAANCVLRIGPAGNPYIRTVPQPQDAADKEQAAARDRKWIERCRPVIEQDRYGVARCEFGVIE
jgi:hypothetical protein